MPLHVGTWNCRVSVPLPKVRLDLTGVNEDGEKVAPGLLSHVEVLGLQEWGGKDRERLLERLRGYDYAKPGDRTGSVVWERKRFALQRAHSEVVAEGRRVG